MKYKLLKFAAMALHLSIHREFRNVILIRDGPIFGIDDNKIKCSSWNIMKTNKQTWSEILTPSGDHVNSFCHDVLDLGNGCAHDH